MSAPGSPRPRLSTRAFTLGALGVALVLACVVSVWASTNPDGLEFVASAFGFGHSATRSVTEASPLAGYTVAGLGGSGWSVIIVGVVGCGLTFGLAWILGRLSRRGSRAARSAQASTAASPE